MTFLTQQSWNGIPSVSYLFVDGGCVRAELNALSRRYLGSDGQAQLAWSFFQQNFTKVFYYDALPARLEEEDDRAYEERNATILKLHNDLRRLDGFHVYEGDVRRARSRKERPQQKKVDVMIAVDMLLHTFRRNMHSATLIASDLDFAPLLHALVREGMQITLWHPPTATTEELMAAADARREFGTRELGSALLDGRGLTMLPTWSHGILHYNQSRPLETWTAPNGWSLRLSGGSHFMAEVFDRNGHAQGYAPHHAALPLLLTAEETYRFRLPDEAFAEYGGRPT